MKKEQKTDRRVIRTKKAIRSAFAELISEKEYSEITVTDIAERADINRKTFYNYYHNTGDLLADIENEAVAEYDRLLDDLKAHDLLDSPELIVTRISRTITENMDYFHDLLIMSKNAVLFSRIADNVKAQIRTILESQAYTDPMQAETLAIFISSGSLSVYREWISRGEPVPREKVDALLTRMTIACMEEMMKK